jgi:hypothetical protein
MSFRRKRYNRPVSDSAVFVLHVDRSKVNPYVLRDSEGRLLLGPFSSIADAHLLAQRLARTCRTAVRVHISDMVEAPVTP